jgi:hypothetical protein
LIEVDFNYPGKSTDKIYVVGTFNDWNKRENRMNYNHLTKAFHCRVKMVAGKHHFMIYYNGQWKLDDTKKSEKDENGEVVSILKIEQN